MTMTAAASRTGGMLCGGESATPRIALQIVAAGLDIARPVVMHRRARREWSWEIVVGEAE